MSDVYKKIRPLLSKFFFNAISGSSANPLLSYFDSLEERINRLESKNTKLPTIESFDSANLVKFDDFFIYTDSVRVERGDNIYLKELPYQIKEVLSVTTSGKPVSFAYSEPKITIFWTNIRHNNTIELQYRVNTDAGSPYADVNFVIFGTFNE